MSDRARQIADLSPEQLDRLLQQARKKKQAAASASIRPRQEAARDVPLSFAQQRLWFLNQLVPDNAVYNISQAVRLIGALNVATLERSINAVIQRHGSLRTRIVTRDGQPAQVVSPELKLALRVVSLEQLPEPEREAELWRQTDADAQQPFDLAHDPLIRAALLRLSRHEHVLLITVHHIVSDGWSLGVLVQELAALYEAFAHGRPSPLKPLPIQYTDFVAWQREWLQGDVLEAQLAFWQAQFDQAIPALALPTDHPRPPIQTFRGATENFVLPAALSAALSDLSRREGLTLFMVLLAGFNVLMARYSGQDDILVGTPIANRTRSEVEGLIGLFANTLVLRSDLSGNPTFRELLRRVRTASLGAYDHQDLPFEMLVEKLQPERDLSRNPIFQVMFVLQNTPVSTLELSGLTLQALPADSGTSKFDLRLSMNEGSGELAGALEYNTDLFESGTITRMLAHFETLLADIVAHPERRLSELRLLTEAEARQLDEWNRTAAPYALDRSLHSLIEEQARRTPEAVAVVFDDNPSQEQALSGPGKALTYAELDRLADRLARQLQQHGVGPNIPVGICAERSLEMIVGLLGILKAGGAYMPLDPAYPSERLAYMLDNARPPVVLVQRHLVERLPGHKATQLLLDAAPPDDLPQMAAVALDPDDLAYVLYTSGSTGQPKGVAVSHRSIVNRLLWMQETYRLDASDHVLQKTPYSFDVSVWEFFWPLLTGARLVIARPEGHKDPAYLVQLIAQQQITTLHFVPSMLGPFLDVQALVFCQSLRRVMCSGEALPLAFAQRFFARVDAELHNLYGPTEAAVDVTFWPCERSSSRSSVPIGRPVANTQIYLLDQHLREVPIGVPGELYIGGVQLARGYLNRPDLTAERFIPHPFAGSAPDVQPGARLYRTGDLARYAPDGAIEYLGRIDDQVKLRGFRIELGEIEAVLRQHVSVAEAVALVREDEPGQRRLVAYILPDITAATGAGQLTTELRGDQVDSWQTIFDSTYAQPTAEADFNIVGWNSSFTGAPLPAESMEEWVDQTVGRIRALGARRVLEIGCGTGLLLLRLAPESSAYVGSDLSAVALDGLRRQVDAQGLRQVTLLQQAADDLRGLDDTSFDVVVLNSVIQYFPSVEYLVEVLAGVARVLAPGGAIFLGDVRSLPLLTAFHTAVQLYGADDTLTIRQLRQQIRRSIAQEQELLIDPAFFSALQQHLPQISRVEIQLKRGRDHNEMNSYRYDVTLHLGADAAPVVANWREWQTENMTVERLRAELRSAESESIGFTAIPNARLQAAGAACRLLSSQEQIDTVGELRARLAASHDPAIDPEDLWALGDELGYSVAITWSSSGAAGSYDAHFYRPETAHTAPVAARPQLDQPVDWSSYANNPLQSKLTQQLVPVLQQHLRERLPEYMVPSAFVLLDRVPLTPNGKLDRQMLPPPLILEIDSGELVAPRTTTEQILADIWSQVLRVERVGVNNNFFALGGDSIISLQIISRALQAGLRLTPQQMFQHQTIAELAKVAVPESASTSQASFAQPAPRRAAGACTPADFPLAQISQQQLDQLLASRGPIEDIYPLGSAQEYMLRCYIENPIPGLYLIYEAFQIRQLQTEPFKLAWQQLLNRHPVLRTSFAWEGLDRALQIVHSDVTISIAYGDWRGLSEAEQAEALAAHIEQTRQQGFDLTTPPFTRLTMFQVSENDYTFFWGFNYLLQEGWSLPLLIKDLFDCYEAACAGRENEQPPSRPFRDYIAWLQRQDMAAAESFWRSALHGFTRPTPLISRMPGNQPQPSTAYSNQWLVLPSEEGEALRAMARQHQLTLNTVLQSAWALLLGHYTGESDIVFGCAVSGRPAELAGMEYMVGPFNNFLPMRVAITPETSLLEWMKAFQIQQVDQRRYEYAPLLDIKRWSEVPADQPLFETYLTFENFPLDPAIIARTSRQMTSITGITQTEHPLRVTVWALNDVMLSMAYYPRCFDDATVSRMLRDIHALILAIVEQPEQRLRQVLSQIA
ncbi:MAG TPA: amino acid adenylation domain-containing protein [Herpetosiphonaceae bacterium]